MKTSYNKAKELLKKYNQEHVIEFIDKADDKTKEKLINQILRIDFNELKELYNKTFESLYVDLEELLPIISVNPENLAREEFEDYKKVGIDIIKNNKFAVVTMAGGQGTRLRTFRSKRYI